MKTNQKVLTFVNAALISTCLASAPASAGIRIVIAPPSEFIATVAPVYFEGRPAYWYQNRWYYRDGRDWRAYDDEPRYLREYREHHEQERHYYGRRDWDRGRDHDRDRDRDWDRRRHDRD